MTRTVARLGRRAWVYPEREWRRIGEERWVVQIWDLTPAAKVRFNAAEAKGETYEWEPDRDTTQNLWPFTTQAEARAAAQKMVAGGELFFGCAEVQCQRIDWFVEEDNVAEWTDVGDSEEFS